MEFLKQVAEAPNNNVIQVLIKKNVSSYILLCFKNIGKTDNSII
jgi:hypothetical protein